MTKITKVWLIIATSLILVGLIIFGGTMMALNWDFRKLSTKSFETNSYDINEAFKNISVITNTADIVLKLSESIATKVVCYEPIKEKHLVSVKDNTLIIEVVDTRKWYDYIGIDFETPKITLYLPKGEYGELSIKGDTGDVEITNDFKFEKIDISLSTGDVKNLASATQNINLNTSTGDIYTSDISAGSLSLSVSTGAITLSDINCVGDVKTKVSTGKTSATSINCKNFISNGNTGSISLKGVIAKEKFSVERTTGDIKMDKCDAAEILIETDTGDVTGTLLSDKIFIAKTDTGRTDLPKTTTGGKCEITTDTGDIKISITP